MISSAILKNLEGKLIQTKTISITNFRAAVLLHGCGVQDGSEITEATAMLISLSKYKAQVQCFAPDRPQTHVVNHLTGQIDTSHARNILEESARIARGNVKPLSFLKAQDYDVLFVPGGFGAAKNLSNFAFKGADMEINDDVVQVLQDFYQQKRYLALCCISPLLIAKLLGKQNGGPGCKLTLGSKGEQWPYAGSIDVAKDFGNEMKESEVNEVVVDEKNKIITAPAYMKGNATPGQVFDNIKQLVDKVAWSLQNDNIQNKVEQEFPLVTLVSVEIKPDRIDDFLKAIFIDAEGSRLEDGCYRFDVCQDIENPNLFKFFEVYTSVQANLIHKEMPHFKAWSAFKETGGVVSQTVQKMNAINFGF